MIKWVERKELLFRDWRQDGHSRARPYALFIALAFKNCEWCFFFYQILILIKSKNYERSKCFFVFQIITNHHKKKNYNKSN